MISQVKTIGFRTEPFENSTVKIIHNDTPLHNQFLEHRIGMIPINIKKPEEFDLDEYLFEIDETNDSSEIKYITTKHIKVKRIATNSYLSESECRKMFPPDPITGARSFPIYQSTAFAFDDSEHAASLYNLQENGNIYGRLSNPTTAALEQKIAALDNAVGSCCVSSGHAAQLIALYPLLSPGKKIVASSKLYGGSITQFTKSFKSFVYFNLSSSEFDFEIKSLRILSPI